MTSAVVLSTPNPPSFSEAQFNSQYGNKGNAEIDPFHGVETYSQKYAPKKRTIPQLSARAPFNKELFPKELWEVLDGQRGQEVRKHVNRIAEKKAAFMGATTTDKAEKVRVMLEKIEKSVGLEDDAETAEDDEPGEEEPEDYDFAEDEEEMGGDYDGEKYFDNGEGDSGDEGDGGNDDY
jgi:DNA-directed RNA polymerase III subunit RPC7